MNKENRFDEQPSPENFALHLYDILADGARYHPEWQETPPETQTVCKALEDIGWKKTENADAAPNDAYSSYAMEFYDEGTCFVCEAWISAKKVHLHQVGGYGVIGVVIGDVPNETFPPFALDELRQMEKIIKQATKTLIDSGIPFLGEESFIGIADPSGKIITQNMNNRWKFNLDEAEKRDLA